MHLQAVESVHGAHVPPEKNGQPVHGPEPVALFHFATSHAVQTPPSGPVYPALQVHMLDTLQPLHDAPELEAQSVHAALPVAILYFPATQAVHVPPLVPV